MVNSSQKDVNCAGTLRDLPMRWGKTAIPPLILVTWFAAVVPMPPSPSLVLVALEVHRLFPMRSSAS
jgi:hypothetical protein